MSLMGGRVMQGERRKKSKRPEERRKEGSMARSKVKRWSWALKQVVEIKDYEYTTHSIKVLMHW